MTLILLIYDIHYTSFCKYIHNMQFIQTLFFIKDFNYMTQLSELIRSKQKSIDYDQFVGIIKMYFHHLEEQDLTSLINMFIQQKKTFSIDQCLYMSASIKKYAQKLQPRQKQLTSFYSNSFLKFEKNRISQQKIDIQTDLDVNKDFKDILGEDFYKRLINYASNGLLFLKLEEKPHKRYKFFQWVQNKIDLSINEESNNLYLMLLKLVWSFKFDQTIQIINKIKITFPKDNQVASIEAGLQIFANIMANIVQNEQLKEVFMDRKQFEIKFQSEHSNKNQQKDFNIKINQIKQQLLFGSNYFLNLKNKYQNKYYFAIATFLGNRENNYVKQHDEVIRINQISIADRFFYAKMFFRSEDFQALKAQLLQSYANQSNLDYIILYGTRKQSQQILQNCIDQRNQLQKTAIISVFQKYFCNKINGLKTTKSPSTTNVLEHINSSSFDQIQVYPNTNSIKERKKKTMNKTFSFNCTHCKYSQCLLSITKRIANDAKQHQVRRMKGNNVFSKDQRNQVMYCLDCMELLPKCSVCLYQITVYNGYAEEAKKNSSNEKQVNCGQSLENSLVWCPKCLHGGHFSHIMKWMKLSSKKCPVYSCKCKCQI